MSQPEGEPYSMPVFLEEGNSPKILNMMDGGE